MLLLSTADLPTILESESEVVVQQMRNDRKLAEDEITVEVLHESRGDLHQK